MIFLRGLKSFIRVYVSLINPISALRVTFNLKS